MYRKLNDFLTVLFLAILCLNYQSIKLKFINILVIIIRDGLIFMLLYCLNHSTATTDKFAAKMTPLSMAATLPGSDASRQPLPSGTA